MVHTDKDKLEDEPPETLNVTLEGVLHVPFVTTTTSFITAIRIKPRRKEEGRRKESEKEKNRKEIVFVPGGD